MKQRLQKIGNIGQFEAIFYNERGELFIGPVWWESQPISKKEVVEDLEHSYKVNYDAAFQNADKPFAHYLDSAFSIYSSRAAYAAKMLKKVNEVAK